MPDRLRTACLSRLAQLVDLLNAQGFGLEPPTVSFDLRGQAAGRAWSARHHIQLNPVLLEENPEAFVREVVGHELAHLAAARRHGPLIRPHGPQWQETMRLIGLAPRRCHPFDTTRASAAPRPYRWDCDCPTPHWLTARRHATALRQGYRCLRCRASMRFERLAA
ncbi:MAG TPA: SprT-like domain-containing protein [Burkholderiaceae bacterium]|nr:SprT-like domain-containing protein [Burkholderiaceae bacterium]